MEVSRHQREGRECVLIGHAGHPEVEGTLGQFESGGPERIHLVESPDDARALQVEDPDRLAYVTQTTLSMDDTNEVIEALRERFPGIAGPKKDDICYATQNRQDAVKELAPKCDVFVVVGSPSSSNSNRLREVAGKLSVPAYLVDNAGELEPEWFEGARTVGVTAGASARRRWFRACSAVSPSGVGAGPRKRRESARASSSRSRRGWAESARACRNHWWGRNGVAGEMKPRVSVLRTRSEPHAWAPVKTSPRSDRNSAFRVWRGNAR